MASWGWLFIIVGAVAVWSLISDVRRLRSEAHSLMDRAEIDHQTGFRAKVIGGVNLTRVRLRQRWFVWNDSLERHYIRLRRKLGLQD